VSFYDETRKWRYVLLNDLRNEAKLGYKYSTVMRPAKPINSLTTTSLVRPDNTFALAPQHVTTLRAQPSAPAFLLITNMQIDKLPEPTRQFGIFSKAVVSGAQANAESGLLGKVSRVFSAQHAHPSPLSASLTITGKAASMTTAGDGTVKLFVAPLSKNGTASAASTPLVADDVSLIR